MAFTESDRVKIRKYLGSSSLYKQLFPKLENAITVVQSIADGGSQASSDTELSIKTIISALESIETKITNLHCTVHVVEAGNKEAVLDTAKGMFLLKSEGRRLIGVLSRTLGVAPVYDYYSGQMPNHDDSYNLYSVM